MSKISLVLTIIFACGVYASAQTKATALSVLQTNEPEVKWNAKSEIKGDFDYDGVIDYALRGRKGKFFVLGIIKGNLSSKSQHWTMQLEEESSNQGSLCSVNSAVITIENLDKDYAEFSKEYLDSSFAEMLKTLPKNSKGINIADGECDSFHVLWDKAKKQFTYWRI